MDNTAKTVKTISFAPNTPAYDMAVALGVATEGWAKKSEFWNAINEAKKTVVLDNIKTKFENGEITRETLEALTAYKASLKDEKSEINKKLEANAEKKLDIDYAVKKNSLEIKRLQNKNKELKEGRKEIVANDRELRDEKHVVTANERATNAALRDVKAYIKTLGL